ncbi:MAG: endonuclease [Hyphomicrobiales bacterium]|nr:MAG: endonuclease [Hyphomicrobiales bacterium]
MLKVASYNIRKSIGTDRRRQPERIMQILAEVNADVVALQEVDRRFGARVSTLSAETIVDHSDYMPVRFGIRQESLGWHGNALLVRKGIEVLDQKRIDIPSFEPRGAVLADIRIGGTLVRIIGMHLGLMGTTRLKQAQAIVGYLEQVEGKAPTVIMGDLNQWAPDGGCLSQFAVHHSVIAPGPSFHSRRPMLGLDRIITSRDIALVEAGVHTSPLASRGSDHLPVWARLNLP